MRKTYILSLALAASLGMGAGVGCSSASDDEPNETPNTDIDSGPGDDGASTDGDTEPAPGLGIDDAPQAKIISSVDFEEPVTTTVAAGPYVFTLYVDKDCGVLDLSDPEDPIDRGRITTPSRIVSVAYDEANQLAYLASDKGDILAIDMTIPGTHTQLASLNVSTLAGGIQGMTRVGDRLFALAGNTLQPLGIARDAVTKVVTKIELQAPVTLDEPATVIDAGGGNLFIGNAKGKLQIFDAPAGKSAPKALGSVDMGGEIKGIVVRGSKVLGIANGAGLKAVDFYKPEAPKVLFESDEIADASGIRVFGTTLVVGLDRGSVSTLDISNINAPRAVTTNKGKLPAWISISKGQLFFGDEKKGNVANIPPFLSGRVTGPTRESFPLKGLVPVTLSKEIDPATVSPETVKLSCDGKEVKGAPTVMPMQHTFIFKPAEALPTGAKCKLDLSGVRDRQGTLVSAPSGGAVMDFTTASDASKPVVNPGSKFPHQTDGVFTDLVVDKDGKVTNEGEWSDVIPAKGMYTYFYADFDGKHLWLMNDWFYGGENIEPDCYNQFHVWTGGGSEWWDVRAFGDQHVEVRKNGVLIDPESDGVEGGASYTPSPNLAEPHTMYEIRVPASPGAWGVQLHDPGPTFNCHVIEQEPHPMQGSLLSEGEGDEGATTTTIDISEPVAPSDVTLFAPFDEMVVNPPVKLVWQTREGLDFTIYQVQIAEDESFTVKSRVLDVGTYSASFDVPNGLLKAGKTYYWHVIAWNTAGSTTSATRSFTVFGEEEEPGDDAVAMVALGGNHSCALKEGEVYCWGDNGLGQIGDGPTEPKLKPTLVEGLTNVVELASGDWHSCARFENGTVKCWGDNAAGQLGHGGLDALSPPTPVADLTDAVELALGREHSCARLQGGNVKCWGRNQFGQLGDGTWEHKRTPILVSDLTGAVEIAAGGRHSCARLASGGVKCWGHNDLGQIGIGGEGSVYTPTLISGLTDVGEIALGGGHSCARLQNGTVKCWGSNDYGQLGDGTSGDNAEKRTPTLVPGLSGVAGIALGSSHSCARLQDGSIKCWGRNGYGRLGDGTLVDKATPTSVSGLTKVAGLAVGGDHTCARLQNNAVRCWGWNHYGQLGDGTKTNKFTPASVVW